ncbi:FAD-dependent oxidoreductase [Streptomyces noursei]|uniref:FAD-dependent oxidoreductase n=1 Tax=Streptomyces noursei TaxID=1971 RepID=UPI0033D5D7A1
MGIRRARRACGRWGRAVVVGGGYAGLVTARVLADYFHEVVILEWDSMDESTGVHPHAPQGYHAHVMLAKGAEVLEKYFPGLRAELQDAGAPVYDYGEYISFLLPTGYAPRCTTGLQIQSFTRDELERHLRRRVLAMPGVTLLSSVRCKGLVTSRPHTVTGVTYHISESTQLEQFKADLVIDASGRSSTLGSWLQDLDLEVPSKRVVKARITYTTMNFDRPQAGAPDFKVAYQMTYAPRIPRGGVVLAVENNRWICSLFGYADQIPPTDDEGYLAFARSLDNPHLAEQLTRRIRQERVRRYTNVNSQWNLYHSCKGWPERLIAAGDSVCAFNPIYGQGLTVAAMEADLLDRMLNTRRAHGWSLDGLSRRYQRGVARIVLTPWTLSSNSDIVWDPDGQPLPAKIVHWYTTRLFEVAVRDAKVWTRFARVVNMITSPAALFHPAIFIKVIGRALLHPRSHRRRLSNYGGGTHCE